MEQQIIDALQHVFAGAEVDLDSMSNGRFSGMIVWAGFAEDDAVERQQRIRAALVATLNGAATNVGVILSYTPHELEAMRAA